MLRLPAGPFLEVGSTISGLGIVSLREVPDYASYVEKLAAYLLKVVCLLVASHAAGVILGADGRRRTSLTFLERIRRRSGVMG